VVPEAQTGAGPLLPHANIPPVRVTVARRIRRASIFGQLRQRVRPAGMTKSRTHASSEACAAFHRIPRCWRLAEEQTLVAAVVEIVRVAVAGAVPVMGTGLVKPKLNVGGS